MAAAIPQTHPTFHVQTVEDDMEISSDIGRDQDIDIDFDVDHAFTPRVTEDDIMQDDARSPEVVTTFQVEMVPDEDTDQVGDGVMADDNVDYTIQDEQLPDASGMENADQILDSDTLIANPDAGRAEIDTFETTIGSNLNQEQNPTNTPFPNALTNETHAARESQVNDLEYNNIDQPPTTNIEDLNVDDGLQIPENASADAFTEPSTETSNTHGHNVQSIDPSKEAESVSAAEVEELDLSEENSPPTSTLKLAENEHANATSWPTSEVYEKEDEDSDDNGEHSSFEDLHPVVVLYDNDKVSLFPPQSPNLPEQFFLQDRSYAQKSLKQLLEACREVLGSTIAEEEDLELTISDLGLTIRENALDDHSVCFSDVLEVYLDLQRHDGINYPDPLYVSLNCRKRFSSIFKSLQQAAKDGKGLTQINVSHGQVDEQYAAGNEDYVDSENGDESDHSEASSHRQIPSASDQSNQDDVSYASEDASEDTGADAPPPDAYEIAKDTDYAESDSEPAPSDHSNTAESQPEETNKAELFRDEMVNTTFDDDDDDEDEEEAAFDETEEITSDIQSIPLTVDGENLNYQASLEVVSPAVEESTQEVPEDTIYYEEDNGDGPAEDSSSPSTLQGERSQQDFDKALPPVGGSQPSLESTQIHTQNPQDAIEESGGDDINLDHTLTAESWIQEDAIDVPNFDHDSGSHTNINDHHSISYTGIEPTSTDVAEAAFDTAGEATGEELKANQEGFDDWQVFLDGDDYAETNQDAANYELDVSAPGPLEGLSDSFVPGEGDSIEYHDAEFDQSIEGRTGNGDSPQGKRTWDDQNDDLGDVLNEQDSKRARAD